MVNSAHCRATTPQMTQHISVFPSEWYWLLLDGRTDFVSREKLPLGDVWT